jgi:hypothetical protein
MPSGWEEDFHNFRRGFKMQKLEKHCCKAPMVSKGVLADELTAMGQELAAPDERRGHERLPLRAVLTVFAGTQEISAYTRDLGERGVYFCMDSSDRALIGRHLEFVIDMPPEITLSSSCRIRCRGYVVRTENTLCDETGIAAEILDYTIQREAANRNSGTSD